MALTLDELADRFLTEGFVVVPVPEVKPQLRETLTAFDHLIRTAELLGRDGKVRVRKSDLVPVAGDGWSWGCDHIYAPELREQQLLNLVSLDPLPDLVRCILGGRIRFSGGHGQWSPATYDYYLHWHRDTRRERWHLGNPDTRAHVQVCLALTDEQVVRVVPGSHLRDAEDWERRYFSEEPHGDHPHQVVVQVPAGCALLLNTYSIHRAQCSKANVRRSLHFGFTRVGAAPEPGRVGKALEWLGGPAFIVAQTAFMRACIEEELRAQAAMTSQSADVQG